MTYPKISIVTPSYNQGNYIEETILSIINQGYPNLEYIIIDGGSTDNTVDIIKKYEDKITYWVSESDKGQSDAINKGLSKCTGDIFNWINSDDLLAEGALEKIADAFIKNPLAEVVCGFTNIFEEESGKTLLQHRTELFETVEKTLAEQRINQQGCFYRLDILRKIGAVNSSLNYVMDLEWWFRYLCRFGQQNVFLIDDVVGGFRVHSTSKTSSFIEKFRKEEGGLLHFILATICPRTPLLTFFNRNERYVPSAWNFNCINGNKLQAELYEKYFFEFYREKNLAAGRGAFLSKLKRRKIPLTPQYSSLFFKLFIKDITFSRVFR